MTHNARRNFLKSLALAGAVVGSTALGSLRLWQGASRPRDGDPLARLARRVVHAMGPTATALSAPPAATAAQLLAIIFPADVHGPLQLDTASLRQHLAARVQQDYQSGALVHVQGWWLARSEAAMLQLHSLLAGGTVQG